MWRNAVKWAVRGFVVLALALVLGPALLLQGCASTVGALPVCPKADAVLIQGPDGQPYAAFTMEQLVVLQNSFEMSARGQCRDEKGTEL